MSDSVSVGGRPLVHRVIAVLWPSFVVAGLGTVLLFTWLDPAELVQCMRGTADVGRVEAYSIGFFALWGLTALAGALTCYFGRTPGR